MFCNKKQPKKILHKIKKRWIIISLVMISVLGGSALIKNTTPAKNITIPVHAQSTTHKDINHANNLLSNSYYKMNNEYYNKDFYYLHDTSYINEAEKLHRKIVDNAIKYDVKYGNADEIAYDTTGPNNKNLKKYFPLNYTDYTTNRKFSSSDSRTVEYAYSNYLSDWDNGLKENVRGQDSDTSAYPGGDGITGAYETIDTPKSDEMRGYVSDPYFNGIDSDPERYSFKVNNSDNAICIKQDYANLPMNVANEKEASSVMKSWNDKPAKINDIPDHSSAKTINNREQNPVLPTPIEHHKYIKHTSHRHVRSKARRYYNSKRHKSHKYRKYHKHAKRRSYKYSDDLRHRISTSM